MTAEEPLLELEDVTVSYGNVRAVQNVSLDISEGEVLSILGPSGSGKSTLIRAIAGLEAVDSGHITLAGRSVSSESVQMRPQDRDIGMVFQNFALWPHKTVRENVAFPLAEDGTASTAVRERVSEVLSLVELDGYEDRYPGDLSGGQQQRVALARALAPDPSLLLLDECLSSLDARLKSRMLSELARIQSEIGVTTIYVTHNQQNAMQLADRIAVLRDGVLQQTGSPSGVYRSPVNEFVANFVGEINVLSCDELKRVFKHSVSGDTSKVGIRPEDLGLRQAAATDGAQLHVPDDPRWQTRGTVEEAVFLGDQTRYEVRIDDVVLTVIEHSRTQLDVGSLVQVEVDQSALIEV
ncbi:MAG: ABC transporter ATP-binding protein [Haloferacaceae archaeon]